MDYDSFLNLDSYSTLFVLSGVCFLSYPIYTLEDRLPIKTLGPGAPQISDPAPSDCPISYL